MSEPIAIVDVISMLKSAISHCILNLDFIVDTAPLLE